MLNIRASVKIDGVCHEIVSNCTAIDGIQARLFCENPAEGLYNATAYLENGASRSGRITELYGLDITVPLDAAETLRFGTLTGDSNDGKSFRPADRVLNPGDTVVREPFGARPSNTTAFPYFDLEWAGQSMVCGIGWSGQWRLTVTRDESSFRITAGQAD